MELKITWPPWQLNGLSTEKSVSHRDRPWRIASHLEETSVHQLQGLWSHLLVMISKFITVLIWLNRYIPNAFCFTTYIPIAGALSQWSISARPSILPHPQKMCGVWGMLWGHTTPGRIHRLKFWDSGNLYHISIHYPIDHIPCGWRIQRWKGSQCSYLHAPPLFPPSWCRWNNSSPTRG